MGKYSNDRVKGFLHTDGMRMVNGNGETVVLRGWGVGNWMNPEGFMIGALRSFNANDGEGFGSFTLPSRFERGRSVYTTVAELCGREYAENFEDRWIENHLTEKDIVFMEELGYNSVRLPISARLFLAEEPGIHFIEKNFKRLEAVFDWCKKHHLYAILDMHGAPGGQSCLSCDDGIDNRPHTFTESESRERALILWEEFAKRYADREEIGGFDLLNEPLSCKPDAELTEELRKFYAECCTRIRKYDKNHMLTLEGTMFSMGMEIFDRDYDETCHNWCIHSHFYGFSPQVRELYRFMEPAVRLNVPVWIGEGGSSPVVNSVFYEIAGFYNIGYARWSWKSCEGSMGSVTYLLPAGWEKLQEYFKDGGPRPSYEESMRIFDEMLENLKFENCQTDKAKYDTDLRHAPFTLPAVGFDEDPAGRHSRGWEYGNSYSFRTETGFKMPLRDGAAPSTPPMASMFGNGMGFGMSGSELSALALELTEGEFVTYTVRDVKDSVSVGIEAKKDADCELVLTAVNEKEESVTGSDSVTLPAGEEWKVQLKCKKGSAVVNDIKFE